MSSSITNLLVENLLTFLSYPANNSDDYFPGELALEVSECEEYTTLSYSFTPAYGGDVPCMLDGREMHFFGEAKETVWLVVSSFCGVRAPLESGIGPFRRSQTSGKLEGMRDCIRRGESARRRQATLYPPKMEALENFLHAHWPRQACSDKSDYITLNQCYFNAVRLAMWVNNIIEYRVERRVYHHLCYHNYGSRNQALNHMGSCYKYRDLVPFDPAHVELRPYRFIGVRVFLPEDVDAPLLVQLVFADSRRPGIQRDEAFCAKMTKEYCLAYGYEELLLHPASRKWIADNGRHHPTRPATRSFQAASMHHVPTFPRE